MAYISGDAGDNLLSGTPDRDDIFGLAGNDTLRGLGGNDYLVGWDGDDSLVGGSGNDTLLGGTGDDTYVGGAGTDFAYVSSYFDLTVSDVTSVEVVIGTGGADALLGDANANDLRGGSGNDRISGREGNDTLSGDTGDDSLYGGAGDDMLVGSSYDNDFADYSGVVSAVTVDLRDGIGTSADGTEGNDTLTDISGVLGGLGDDTIFGSNGADDLRGRQGDDVLQARAGDDTLDGGLGQDILRGGSGSDTARYTSHTRAMTIDLANLTAYATGTSALTDQLAAIENAIGGSGNDRLIGSAIGQSLDGGKGNDTVDGAGGDDTLAGSVGTDLLQGSAGNDTLLATPFPDLETGEDDSRGTEWFWDLLQDDGPDTLDGGAGRDTVAVSSADYVYYYGAVEGVLDASVNLATGTLRHDFPDSSTDRLISIENVETGTGDDTVVGNAAANALSVGDGQNIVHAGNGNDTVVGGTFEIPDWGDIWQDELYGESGDDLLIGNGSLRTGTDVEPIEGPGSDFLDGGVGNDTLEGGPGRTVMHGGAGADHFQSSNGAYINYDRLEMAYFAYAERSEIDDFNAAEGDKIVVSIVENPYQATPTFVGQVADLGSLNEFEFGYTMDGDDLVARFVTTHPDAWIDQDLGIRLTDFAGGLVSDDVLFV